MDPLKGKANYSRVCQLLVDKGGVVLRNALHAVHRPSTLASVLNANKKTLQRLRYSVIKAPQWDLLFPRSGTPDSNNFDISLLTVLLRNICGLSPPATGWNVMPPVSDTSISANILRVKMYRNEVYGHIPTASLDDGTFQTLWQEISLPLVNLGIPQKDIDELKVAALSPEEESYIERLKEWKQLEDDFISKMDKVESEVGKLRKTVENVHHSHIEQLAKFNFTGKVDELCGKFHDGTRKWLFDEVSSWFVSKETRVMILTAGPGFGKSVLSGKVSELYRERGQLAAHHFCDFRNSDYSNPHRILQSLASQMCDNVDGFRDKLTEILRREHSRDSLSDAFRVLLNDPLHALDRHDPMLIIVDALDETKTDAKSEFLELISEKFSELPHWIKIFILSRPELQVRKVLQHLHPLEIRPDDEDHNHDILLFIRRDLPNLHDDSIRSVISKCEGSFLYAYYLVSELREKGLGIEPDLSNCIPNGIAGYYEKQFKRLKIGLQRLKQDSSSSILESFINVIAASRRPLAFKIIFTCMELSWEEYEIRKAIIDIMSEILPVYDGCLTVYHKSLWDWLTLNGYEEHAFVADVIDGNRRLWRACEKKFCEIESLRSVFEFKISPENMYALENGVKYLVNTGEVKEFHWLVHVGVNFLRLKFCDHMMNVDFSQILGRYLSDVSKDIYCGIIQLHCFFESTTKYHHFPKESGYVYLQTLANGHFDFSQNTRRKNRAREILDRTNEVWIEHVGNEENSNVNLVAHAVSSIRLLSSGYREHRRVPCLVSMSPDNKMFALFNIADRTVQVLEIPSLATIFEIQVNKIQNDLHQFFGFSPDSSYFLCNSVRSCVLVKEQKEVPFIANGAEDIWNCSFSSGGMKLVTLGKGLIQVWDVMKKTLLVETDNVFADIFCLFSLCASYIVFLDGDKMVTGCKYNIIKRDISFSDWASRSSSATNTNVLNSANLEKLDIENVSIKPCLPSKDSFQIYSPDCFYSASDDRIRFHHICLPSGETVLVCNKNCSKTFLWKDKKCVAFTDTFKSGLALVVYDVVNQKIVEVFQIGCLPYNSTIDRIAKLEGANFLLSLCYGQVLVLSLESLPNASFVDNDQINCCALSPDNLYVACCFENCILSIRSVDSGETLQTVELKQKAVACWWSELCLWLVCKGVVVKYRYEPMNANILASQVEESMVNFERVEKFSNGVLVIGANRRISILKICGENLCDQEIPSWNLYEAPYESQNPSVAISPDGCAVMLWCPSTRNYQLWEIECGIRWAVRSTGELNESAKWFCLSGTNGARSSILLTSKTNNIFTELRLLSIAFLNGMQDVHVLPLPHLQGVINMDSEMIGVFSYGWIHFVNVSEGRVIASRELGGFSFDDLTSSFFLPSTGVFLFVGRNGNKYFKIHTIEKYLSLL